MSPSTERRRFIAAVAASALAGPALANTPTHAPLKPPRGLVLPRIGTPEHLADLLQQLART